MKFMKPMRPITPSRKNLLFSVLAAGLLLTLPLLWAAEKDEDAGVTKQSSVQNVGGLLFDVDEGVKIEKGAGGSVYVKSNRDEMQQKFDEINRRLDSLDDRLAVIEKKFEPEKKSNTGPASAEKTAAGRRVLTA